MAVITTQTHPKFLWPGQKDIWGDHYYNRWDEEYSQIFEVVSSDKAFEEYTGVTGFGLTPVKSQGQPYVNDTEQQGFTKRFTNIAYALGYQITREEIEDNLYEKVTSQRTPALSRSMRLTVETVDANHLNRATNTSYTGADGKELLATDHPNVNGGTYSNELSTAADLSETSVEDLTIMVMKALDDRGLQMQLKPRCLVVHPNESYNMYRILGSELQNDTANNAINVIRSKGIFPDGGKVNHYLTDTDAWFVITDCPNGLMHLERTAPDIEMDNDFSTKNMLVSGFMRFSSGLNLVPSDEKSSEENSVNCGDISLRQSAAKTLH